MMIHGENYRLPSSLSEHGHVASIGIMMANLESLHLKNDCGILISPSSFLVLHWILSFRNILKFLGVVGDKYYF
jgi:hypothetical protein